MAPSASGKSPRLLQFGVFEVDLQQGELRKHGRRVKLQELPFQFLAALLDRPGEVVTREDLARRLWSGALVDFDSGLNTAARKLRDALGDDAVTPRYVETLPRRGYRFIAPIQAPEAPLPEAAVPEIPVDVPQPVPPRRRALYLGILVPAAILIVLVVYRLSAPFRPPRVLDVVQLTQTGRVEMANGVVTDGSRVYFSERKGGRWSLAQVSVHGGASQPLPLAKPLNRPDILDISPDRSSLLVSAQEGLENDPPLWVVPTLGGMPRRLGDVRGGAAAWSRDGSHIVYALGSALFLVNSDGADPHKLLDTTGAPDCIHWAPAPQPDLLRFSLVTPDLRAYILWEVSSAGAGLHPLLSRWTPGGKYPDGEDSGTWLAGGKYYLFRSRRGHGYSVWAMAGDRGFLRPGGPPVQIYSASQQSMWLAPQPDGKRLFFAAGQEHRDLVRYDNRRGQFLPFLSGIAARWISFSNDGRFVAYTTAPQETLWCSRADGSDAIQLTSTNLTAYQPRWSPDGKLIAFSGAPFGQTSKVYVIPATGGAPEPIKPLPSTLPFRDGDVSWSPDGNSLVFGRSLPAGVAGQPGLYVMDWKTRVARFLPGSEALARAAWSPDQHYIAATGYGGGGIDLLDLKTGQWTPLATGSGLGIPLWSPDSQYVYYQEVLGGPEQPIFRVQIHTRKLEKTMSASQIPQSNLTSYVMTGMAPGDEPIATVLRSNSDIYALDLELP
jgi:Tol biopolymer transport system component/DNA-binding winged helix-turn-helix (wHTH) protein